LNSNTKLCFGCRLPCLYHYIKSTMLCTLLTIDEFENALDKEPHFFVYKYNSRSCPISDRTLNRLLELQQTKPSHIYFVDVIQSKPVSNHIADSLQVRHESPQIISIKEGKSHDAVSHMRITQDRVLNQHNLMNSWN